MSRMNLSVNIQATPETVFAIVSDVANSPAYIDGHEKIDLLTEGPLRVGSRWRETRRMGNKRSVEEWEMTAIDSPRYFTAYCDSRGYDVEWTMRVEPEQTGSKLVLEMETQPRTRLGKLLTPLEWLMAGMCRKLVQKDLESTKAYIERMDDGSTHLQNSDG